MKKLLLAGAVSLFLVGCADEQPADDTDTGTDPATEETDPGTEVDQDLEQDTEEVDTEEVDPAEGDADQGSE